MNSKQRQALSLSYIRLTRLWEAEYQPLIAAVINSQIRVAVSKLRGDNGLNEAIRYLNNLRFDAKLEKVLSKLFRSFSIAYAEISYKRLIKVSIKYAKAAGGSFGFNDDWNQAVTDYLNQFLLNRAVIPVTEGTKKQILEVLLEGQSQGWGIDRIIQELNNKDMGELTDFRARRIVRTEIPIAANFADKLAQDSVPFEVQKVWISVNDKRTRDSHHKMDNVTVDGDADFHVPIIKGKVQIGIDLMSGPGDPEATPGNVINCRCTRALVPKRDKNNRLIPKIPKHNQKQIA